MKFWGYSGLNAPTYLISTQECFDLFGRGPLFEGNKIIIADYKTHIMLQEYWSFSNKLRIAFRNAWNTKNIDVFFAIMEDTETVRETYVDEDVIKKFRTLIP